MASSLYDITNDLITTENERYNYLTFAFDTHLCTANGLYLGRRLLREGLDGSSFYTEAHYRSWLSLIEEIRGRENLPTSNELSDTLEGLAVNHSPEMTETQEVAVVPAIVAATTAAHDMEVEAASAMDIEPADEALNNQNNNNLYGPINFFQPAAESTPRDESEEDEISTLIIS